MKEKIIKTLQLLIIFLLTIYIKTTNIYAEVSTTIYSGSLEKNLESGEIKVSSTAGTTGVVKTISSSGDSELVYTHSDHLGSTVLLTDSSGKKITDSEIKYYPYGDEVTPIPDTVTTQATDRLYTGQRQDIDIDLYYYNARYYNPTIGKFISADKAEGPNRYAYVGNNPVMRNDPSGNMGDDPEKYALKHRLSKTNGFNNLINTFMESINNGEGMSGIEKMNAWVMYLGDKIPYSPFALDRFYYKDNLNREYYSLSEEASDSKYMSLSKKRKEARYMDQYDIDRPFWDEYEREKTLDEHYYNNNFICQDFALLTSMVGNEVLNVPTYAIATSGHAFNLIKTDGQLYVGDPQGIPFMTIKQEKKLYGSWKNYFQLYPDWDQQTVGKYGKDSLSSRDYARLLAIKDTYYEALGVKKPKATKYKQVQKD